jgi:fructose-specific phosphotransferase system component IIB
MKLGAEKIESLIRAAEHAARTYIVSRLQKSEVEDLEITVEVETDGDLSFDVEVNLDAIQDKDIYQGLVDGAVEAAHAAIKTELDKLASHQTD